MIRFDARTRLVTWTMTTTEAHDLADFLELEGNDRSTAEDLRAAARQGVPSAG